MIDGLDSVTVYTVAACTLVGVGLHGLIARPEALRKLLAVNVLGVGVFLLLITLAAAAPGERGPDPVPHALVLTGIVVAVSLTAVAVAIIRRLAAMQGDARLPEEGAPVSDDDGEHDG
jgi:multicomponent Na+:H+ antiporter subunit C